MPDTTLDNEDPKKDTGPQSDQDGKDLEEAQKEAAEEREEEGGYQ